MKPHSILPSLRQGLTVAKVTLLFLLVILCGVGLVSGTAQSSQDEAAAPAEEREFKSTVPEHVPIKVKVKNEQSFKRKENKNWARELEIEVKNTGSKPIYYLYMVVAMPDVLVGGNEMAFQVGYGRKELAFLETKVEPDDVPIKPGETVVLKIRESRVRGYEKWRDEENRPDPKRIEFHMQIINFGDGTGYRSVEGNFDSIRKQSQNALPSKTRTEICSTARGGRVADSPGKLLKAIYSEMPASFLRANFSPADGASTSVPASPLFDQCGCQNSNDCMWGERDFPTYCPCDDVSDFPSVSPAGGCANTRGRCLRVKTQTDSCDTEFNGRQFCTYQLELGNCALGDPPPTPTPTPSPGATPAQCDPATRPHDQCLCDRTTGAWQCCNLNTRPNPGCSCRQVPGTGGMGWDCGSTCPVIEGGTHANYPRYPGTAGCHPNAFNDGDCCKCLNQNPTCPPDFPNWNREVCNCCNSSGQCLGDSAGGGDPCSGAGYRCGVYAEVGVEGCYPEGSGACAGNSPVLIDVLGDGFRLTSAARGVDFDMDGDGYRQRLSWTRAGTDDAWLALDRNGNGTVDGGWEVFGNFTWQMLTDNPNGFLALAWFDAPGRGGNSDGVIDSHDAVFTRLRLWQDVNHNGVSEPGELHTLLSLDVARLHLDYRESRRADEHGNQFRYRAKVKDRRGAQVGRWAWDVFLVSAP